MAQISSENQYSLEGMEESAALSIAESRYLHDFCPNPNEIIEGLCNTASESTSSHADHLLGWEKRLSDHCFDQISTTPRALDCCLREVSASKFLIARVCGLDEDDYTVRAPRIGRSLNRSFQLCADAPQHKVVRILNKWKNKEKQRQLQLHNVMTRLRDKERLLLQGKAKGNRNAFIRSHRIAQSIMGKPAVDTFLATRETKIQGVLYEYVVTQREHSLLSSGGHGQTLLTVCTLDGEPICDLCIYSKDCTLLDHVVGIFTRIKAGEELTILETGNVFNVREPQRAEADHITSLKGRPVSNALNTDDFLRQIQRSILNMDDIVQKMDDSVKQKRSRRRVFLRDFVKNHFDVRNVTAKIKSVKERTLSVDLASAKMEWLNNNPFHLGPQRLTVRPS